MNTLLKKVESSEQTMSSLEISGLTEKNHQHVLRDIDKMFNELALSPDLVSVKTDSYKDKSGKSNRLINLNRRETDILMSGYSIKYRAAIVDRWHELEKKEQKSALPGNYLEALKALTEEVEEKQLLLAEKTENAPKVEFFEAVENSNSTTSIGDWAKMLASDNGIKIGQNRLFKFLRKSGYFIENKTMPYQKYIDNGYFVVGDSVRNGKTFPYSRITGKGKTALSTKIIEQYKGTDEKNT